MFNHYEKSFETWKIINFAFQNSINDTKLEE